MSHSDFARFGNEGTNWLRVVLIGSVAFVGGLLVLGTSFGAFYTVDQGERGVVLHYGEVSKVAEPGLHFKMPYIDRVVRIPTRTTTGTMKDIFAYSSDQQPAQIALSVTYSVASLAKLTTSTNWRSFRSSNRKLKLSSASSPLFVLSSTAKT